MSLPEVTATNNLVAERTVLAAAIASQEALFTVMEGVRVEFFSIEEHRAIYAAILSLRDRNIEPNVFSVRDELRRTGATEDAASVLGRLLGGGKGYESAIEDVRDAAVKRDLSALTFRIAHDISDPTTSAEEVLAFVDRRLVEIAAHTQSRSVLTWPESADRYRRHLEEVCERRDATTTGLRTGLVKLDDITAGLQDGDLVIVAARPSMGKTSLAITATRNVARQKKPVAIFSLEMNAMQLVMQITAAETRTPMEHLRRGQVSPEENRRVLQFLAEERGIFIDDSPTLTPVELRAKAAQLKHRHDIALVVVDYMQLMHVPKAESREREIATISRNLKVLAKELSVPVLAVAQLNRSAEGRSDKRPMLSDLRESGAIEQDADVVIFCYRPEYYNITLDDKNESTEGKGYLIVAKQRQGRTGEMEFHFHGEYAAWENIEEVYQQPPTHWPTHDDQWP